MMTVWQIVVLVMVGMLGCGLVVGTLAMRTIIRDLREKGDEEVW